MVIETCGLFDLRPQELNFPALFDLARSQAENTVRISTSARTLDNR